LQASQQAVVVVDHNKAQTVAMVAVVVVVGTAFQLAVLDSRCKDLMAETVPAVQLSVLAVAVVHLPLALMLSDLPAVLVELELALQPLPAEASQPPIQVAVAVVV
jgi:hypothetical protein